MIGCSHAVNGCPNKLLNFREVHVCSISAMSNTLYTSVVALTWQSGRPSRPAGWRFGRRRQWRHLPGPSLSALPASASSPAQHTSATADPNPPCATTLPPKHTPEICTNTLFHILHLCAGNARTSLHVPWDSLLAHSFFQGL